MVRTVCGVDEPARRSIRERLDLDTAGVAWLAVAGAVVTGCVLIVLATADAVVERDGFAARDPVRLAWFIEHRSPAAVRGATAVTWLGTGWVVAIVCAVAAGVLWRKGVAPVLAAAPAVSAILAVVTATVAKQVFGRPRPPVGLHLVIATEPAFPSGHATNSTAVYVTIALVVAGAVLRRWAARVAVVGLGLAIAVMVGLSRLTLGVHWPSDVVAGWALGLGIAVVVSTNSLVLAALPGRGSRLPPSG